MVEAKSRLAIAVQSAAIIAGETVTGEIHLQLGTPLPGSGLFLYFKGVEATQWARNPAEQGKASNSAFSQGYSGKHFIVKHRYQVFASEAQILPAGQYCFPFTLRTPLDLPGTFTYEPEFNALKQPGRTTGTIRYYLVGKMEGVGVEIGKVKVEVEVSRPLTEQGDAAVAESSTSLKAWCCCGQGYVRVKADLGKGAFTPNENATVLIDINNEMSSAKASGVRLSLIRKLRLRDTSGSSHLVVDSLVSVDCAQKISTGLDLLSSSRCILTVPIPQGPVSVHSSLIECDYWVQAEVVMEGLLCGGVSPSVEKRLVVYRPTIDKAVRPKNLPKDWSPVLMPAVALDAAAGHEYSHS